MDRLSSAAAAATAAPAPSAPSAHATIASHAYWTRHIERLILLSAGLEAICGPSRVVRELRALLSHVRKLRHCGAAQRLFVAAQLRAMSTWLAEAKGPSAVYVTAMEDVAASIFSREEEERERRLNGDGTDGAELVGDESEILSPIPREPLDDALPTAARATAVLDVLDRVIADLSHNHPTEAAAVAAAPSSFDGAGSAAVFEVLACLAGAREALDRFAADTAAVTAPLTPATVAVRAAHIRRALEDACRRVEAIVAPVRGQLEQWRGELAALGPSAEDPRLPPLRKALREAHAALTAAAGRHGKATEHRKGLEEEAANVQVLENDTI